MTMLVASYLQKKKRKLTLTQNRINTERANHFLEKFIIKAIKSKQKQPTNCLSMFDHFVGLVLKGLI